MSNVAKLKKRALEYEQKKQFDKALDAYMQVLGAMGDHVEEADVALFNRVGDLLLRQGNVASAVDHYERAVDLYTEGGFHNNAIALCSKILRNAPGRNSIYYKLGRISAKKGFTSDAKSNFLEYADRMQRIGHVEEAFRALKEFADLCPDQDDIRLMLADQLVRGDRKPEAIEQLQLLFEKFDSEGRTQEAKATLERMKAIDPSHQPTPGVMRPTPKANDLIFLDVTYDGPGHQPPKPTGAPAVASSDAAVGIEAVDLESPRLATEQALPMLEIEPADIVEIAPVDGLSSGAGFDSDGGAPASRANGLVSQIDPELIMGFEETSLGGTDQEHSEIAPLSDVQQSVPLELGASDLSEPLAELEPESLPAIAGTDVFTSSGIDDANVGDELPMLDISLDLIDDDAVSGGELTFVFPDGEADEGWNVGSPAARDSGSGDAAAGISVDDVEVGHGVVDSMEPVDNLDNVDVVDSADVAGNVDVDVDPGRGVVDSVEDAQWPGPAEDDLHLEPLLQLPELETGPDALMVLGQEQDLPLIAQRENGLSHGAIDGDTETVDSPSSGPELRFLDLGSDVDENVHSGSTEIPGFEFLDIGVPANEPSDDAPSTLDTLRTSVELDPTNWELRRRFAEALFEGGDRDGGLHELEAAMLGLERAGDIRSAKAIVDEMIRVDPRDVRYHQKRVEYAVLANDRSLLAEAYYSLAESLFQMGELAKSRAVYTRVLELTPGDPGVRAALEAIDADGAADELVAEREPEPEMVPSTNGVATAAPVAMPAPVAEAVQVDAPAAEPIGPSVEAAAAGMSAVDASVAGASIEVRADNASTADASLAVSTHETSTSDASAAVAMDDASTSDGSVAEAPVVEPIATAAAKAETPTETAPGRAAEAPWDSEAPASRGHEARPLPASTSGDFVNLADWLSEDEPTRNTRMVVDVKEPEIQDQVDFAEMLAMFKQGVAANVDEADHEAHYDLGVAYKEMGLLDEAISEFQKALRGTGNRARTYEALGQCFVEKGQHQIAVTILSRALGDKSNTDDMLVGVLYLLGFASETLGRWADAQRFYERVFAVDIEFRDIADRLAVAERGGK